jgi:hypothetical protein
LPAPSHAPHGAEVWGQPPSWGKAAELHLIDDRPGLDQRGDDLGVAVLSRKVQRGAPGEPGSPVEAIRRDVKTLRSKGRHLMPFHMPLFTKRWGGCQSRLGLLKAAPVFELPLGKKALLMWILFLPFYLKFLSSIIAIFIPLASWKI